MARRQRSSTGHWGKPPRRLAAQRKAKAAVRGRRRESYRASQPISVQDAKRTGPRRWLPFGRPALGTTRRSWGRLAGLALLAVLLATLALLFVNDDFYVESAEITGATYSDVDEIYRISGVHDFSLFWVNASEAEQRVEQLPFVKSARVWPLLPHKVHIDVLERQPVLLWQANGQAFWVDADGVVLPVAASNDSLPVLVDLDGSSLDSQGQVDPQMVAAVLQLDAQLPALERVAWSQDRGLHFVSPDGTLVVLGRDSRLAERVRQLVALQSELAAEGRQASEIDLRLDGGYHMKIAP
jgi:cell division septal protein FtsQ